MSMTDPIADMLTRIRNACQAKHQRVEVPASKVKAEIARILLNHKFISHYTQVEDGKQGIIRIYLRYGPVGESIISTLKRISKPGRRVYVKADGLPRVLNGLGVAILSTPKGIVTDREARQLNTGGEVLCYIW
ncbi:MAG: 30S ribosomal protein S8 [Gemmatimonadetes bacterium]|nr:30S ribosomal protein S8 [Gemmatimonadota bacterium]MXY98292.1 30S ribosomal protein S8 [Gemmatimonadota bacterium]